MGAVVGGIIGGVAAIFAVIGIVTFVQRRRRRRRSPEYTGPQMIVTPFDLNYFNANQDSEISAEQQPLVIGDPEAEVVAQHRLSSSPPAVLPLLGQVAPVPGLSDKEIAQLRAEALSSPKRHKFRVSALKASQPTTLLHAVTESEQSPYDNRRLHSEFESLRREVEQLRSEGLVDAAPPRYAEGDG